MSARVCVSYLLLSPGAAFLPRRSTGGGHVVGAQALCAPAVGQTVECVVYRSEVTVELARRGMP